MKRPVMIDSGWISVSEALVGAVAAAWLRSAVTTTLLISVLSVPEPAGVPPAAAASAAMAGAPAISAAMDTVSASALESECLVIYPSLDWRGLKLRLVATCERGGPLWDVQAPNPRVDTSPASAAVVVRL